MKPNILFITADQWRGDCLGIAGHPAIRTPAIDALAAEGTYFARHYAGAAPCSPARASIYTGLYQMNHRVCRNGSPLDARFDNVALAARRAGYDPTMFGYTDVSPDPRRLHPRDPHLTSYEGVLPGFTTGQLLLENEKSWLSWLRARGRADARNRSVHLASAPGRPDTDFQPPAYRAEETETAFLAERFIDWMGQQDRPWFAHVSFLRPHPPFTVPEPYLSMFDPQEGPSFARAINRASDAEIHPYVAWEMQRQMKASFVFGAQGRVTDWQAQDFARIRAVYYGMIAEVDAQLARMIAALRAAGQWDNTLVVFTSDHGEMMGDHWLLGKGGFFDGSYHIPLVIRDPAGRGGRGLKVDRFSSAADLMPTLCERMGVEPGNHLDGRSLTPFLDGLTPPNWRDVVFWEFDFRDIAAGSAERHFRLPSALCNLAVIRDENYKYVHFAGLPPLLFDLAGDPGELVNIADDPAYLRIRLGYAEELLALRAAHLDQTLAYTELTEEGAVSRFGGYAPV